MNKIIITTSLLLLSICQTIAQPCSQLWEKLNMTFDSEQRLDLLNEYIDSGCKDSIAMAYLYRGDILNEIGDTVYANQAYRMAVKINPDFSEGWYRLAVLSTSSFNCF